MDLSNLLSGFAGSILGVLVTGGLYWHSQYSAARRALIDRLEILLHDVHWNCSNSDVLNTWNASLKELWVLHNAVIQFAPPIIRRSRIREAWENYKGEDRDTVEKAALDGVIIDNKFPPKNKDDFKHKIFSYLKALSIGYK